MADILDVLTAQESRDAIPGGATPDSTKLAMLTTAVSRTLDKLCGPIVTRSVSRTFFAPTGALWLDVPPGSSTFTVSNLAVTEYSGGVATVLAAETAIVSTGNDYRYDPTHGELRRRSSWMDARWGTQEVLVVYMAGRYASTATVDAVFKQAAKETLRHNWTVEQGFTSLTADAVPVVGSSYTVPKKVLGYLTNELLGLGIA